MEHNTSRTNDMKILKYKVCKYFDDVYEKTIAKGLNKEEAKEIRDEANTEYGHDYTSYEIKEDVEEIPQMKGTREALDKLTPPNKRRRLTNIMKIQKNQIYTENEGILTITEEIVPWEFKRGLHNKDVCMGQAENEKGEVFAVYPFECGLNNNCYCWATAKKVPFKQEKEIIINDK